METTGTTVLKLEALRYIPSSKGGGWQVRCGTRIHECSSLRQFQTVEQIATFAQAAIAQPGRWIAVDNQGQ